MQYNEESVEKLVRSQYKIDPKLPVTVVTDFTQPSAKGIVCYFSVSFIRDKMKTELSLVVSEEGHFENYIEE